MKILRKSAKINSSKYLFAFLTINLLANWAWAQGQGLNCTLRAGSPPWLRAEGISELAGDVLIVCTGGTPGSTTTADIRVYPNAPITSRVLNADNDSEAILLVDDPLPQSQVPGVNLFQAKQGSPLTFWRVPITAPGNGQRTLRLTNLRVNASRISSGHSPGTVEFLILASESGGSFTLVNSQVTVGVVQPGVSAVIRTPDDTAAGPVNFTKCAGRSATSPAFNVKFTEGFSYAFKAANPALNATEPGVNYPFESGTFNKSLPAGTGLHRAGVADNGTRLITRFNNVPPEVSIYVTVIPSPYGTTPRTAPRARLITTDSDGSGPYSEAPATGTITINGVTVGIAPVTLTGGSGIAVWEVSNPDPMTQESISFGVVVSYAPTSSSARWSTTKVKAGLAPVSADFYASATSAITRFTDVENVWMDALTVQDCAPCNALITPYDASVWPGSTPAFLVKVTADAGCGWTASGGTWLRVGNGSPVIGSGPLWIGVEVPKNDSGFGRTDNVSVAGQRLQVYQPAPNLSIANNATRLTGPVAPGETVFLQGNEIGPVTPVSWSASNPTETIPTVLGNTRVLCESVPAPLRLVSSTAIIALMPYAISGRLSITCVVEYNGVNRDLVTVPVATTAPGVYGNMIFNDDGTLNGNSPNPNSGPYPTVRGSVVTVYLNGAGDTTPAGIDGKEYVGASDLRPVPMLPVTATLNGTPAEVLSASLAAPATAQQAQFLPGGMEVKIRIPEGVPAGNLPLVIAVGGVQSQPGVTVAVSTTACSYTLSPAPSAIPASGETGSFAVYTQTGCAWSANSGASWITINNPGIHTSTGTVDFTVAANNSTAARTANVTVEGQTYTISQAATPTSSPVILSASPLRAGAVGVAYSQSLAATGAPVSWSLLSGALATGLTLDPAMGTISGTPSVAGTFTFTVQATNSSGSNSKQFSLIVEPPPVALRFVPVTPCRVVDTRNPAGPFGGPALNNNSRDFSIPNSPCGIPANAAAYSLNLTVVPTGWLGFVTIWPTGLPRPVVSTLNSLDGRIKADAVIVPAGTNGSVSVFATNATDVVLDINGYFVAASDPAGLAYYPITPCRLLDTRGATGTLGGPALAGGQKRDFPLSGSCGIPSTARAYALNFTAVPSGYLGFLSTWPAGSPQPLVSTLNAPTGGVTANAAIVPAGTSGVVSVSATESTHLVIDVNGYFAPPAANGLAFYTVNPCRVVDTRVAVGPLGGPSISGQRSFPLSTSSCGLPSNAQAFSLNATVVPHGSLGYLTLWSAGLGMPVVSTLNALDGSLVSNAAIVPTSNGSIDAYATSGTDLILDTNGYFAP